MRSVFQWTLAAFLILVSVLAVSYLQHRFDQSDLRRAVEVVRATHPQTGNAETLTQKIAARYQVSPEAIEWLPSMESKVQGTVIVDAKIAREGMPRLAWEVDLVRFNVSPATEAARRLSEPREKK